MQDAASPGQLARRLAEELLEEPHDVQGLTMYLARGEHSQRRLIEEGVHEWAESAPCRPSSGAAGRCATSARASATTA
jgi:hypothetical protein